MNTQANDRNDDAHTFEMKNKRKVERKKKSTMSVVFFDLFEWVFNAHGIIDTLFMTRWSEIMCKQWSILLIVLKFQFWLWLILTPNLDPKSIKWQIFNELWIWIAWPVDDSPLELAINRNVKLYWFSGCLTITTIKLQTSICRSGYEMKLEARLELGMRFLMLIGRVAV